MATLAGTVPQKNKSADSASVRARIARFRVAGTSAADTAAAVERWVAPRGEGALLVARETPDLPVAAVAAARSGAVLLPVPAGKPLPETMRSHLKKLRPDWVRVVGGPRAIPDATVLQALKAAGLST